MDSNTLESSIKSIEEYVIDEGKIVTYKWLCRSLGVHINTAKQLLYTFATQKSANFKDEISCTYFISGLKENGDRIVTVVNEDELETIRCSLENVLSEHIYSVQKGKRIADMQTLYGVDLFAQNNSISPITCSEAVRRPSCDLVVKKETIIKVDKPPAPSKTSEPVRDVTNKLKEVKVEKEKDAPSKKTVGAKKENSISSMFSAQSAKPKSSPVKKIVPESKVSTPDNTKSKSTEDKSKAKDSKPEKKEKKKNKAKKDEDLSEKKRKRIQVFSDSEDSEEETQKEKSPSPEPQPEPEPELKILADSDDDVQKSLNDSQETHKRKKRKIVDKLVMNDDGYMETTKDVVLMTDSEDESVPTTSKASDPQPAKKASPEKRKSPPAAKAISPTKKGKGKAVVNDGKKQASLLSFFKKN